MTLRDQLSAYLDGWASDLSPSWVEFFDGVEPDLAAIDPNLPADDRFPIIPGRRGAPNPGAPAGAHVFRAFDGIDPDDVSVVVIGQDPYPRVSRATGRAFEDGALTDWDGTVAVSLRRLTQSALALRYDRPGLADDWRAVKQGIADTSLILEPITGYFDRLQHDHGVIFVNAGWTLTKFVPGGGADQRAHIACWAPMMRRVLRGLAERPSGCVVYLLLGAFARRLFDGSGVERDARASGKWGVTIGKVEHPHPSSTGATGYAASGNPLEKVNAVLSELGAREVVW